MMSAFGMANMGSTTIGVLFLQFFAATTARELCLHLQRVPFPPPAAHLSSGGAWIGGSHGGGAQGVVALHKSWAQQAEEIYPPRSRQQLLYLPGMLVCTTISLDKIMHRSRFSDLSLPLICNLSALFEI